MDSNKATGAVREAPSEIPADRSESALRREIFAERVRLIYADSRLTAGINLVNTGILAFAQREAVAGTIVAGWAVYMVLVVVLRVFLEQWYRRSAPGVAEAETWSRRYMASAAMGGLGWGAAGLLLMPAALPSHQVLTAFVLAGMAAGGMPTLSRIFSTYAVFAVPVLAPAILFFLWQGTELGVSMALMGSLLLAFLLFIGHRQQEAVIGSLHLAHENTNLVRYLRKEQRRTTDEKARAEQVNEELMREIAGRQLVEAQLRDREKNLAQAQRIAHLGSWELDVATDMVYASEENYRMFGRTDIREKPYTLKSFLEKVHPEDRASAENAVRTALKTLQPYSVEYRVILPDGSERVFFEQGEVVCDEEGRVVRVAGINFDVTDRHRAQEQLRAAMRQAETANEAKSQFLANMSHELRTPLNAIIGYSEILKEDAQSGGAKEMIDDLDRINLAGRHLLALVDEVLDLAKIEAGKTELLLETFEVAPLLDKVAATVRPLVDKNGNRLSVSCPPDVGKMLADITKVRQVLYNLLSNAAKFTENGEIHAEVSQIVDKNGSGPGGWIVFAISDTGIGIAPDRLELAFSAFEQADPSIARDYGGTGLGLAISRHYCELMGGAISVESTLGKGSVFTVRLPADTAAACAPADVTQPSPDS